MPHDSQKEGGPDDAEILRARARVLARPPEDAPAAALLDVLEFRLAQERYALETRYVREVCPLKDVTPVNVSMGLTTALLSGQVDATIGGFRNFEMNAAKDADSIRSFPESAPLAAR